MLHISYKERHFYIRNSCHLILMKCALPLCCGCCVGSRTREKEDTSSERVVTNVCTKFGA